MNDFTLVLQSAVKGNQSEPDRLMPMIYDELRRLARIHMSREFGPNTLQATVLVHEAWLRLVEDGDKTWENRACFFAAASSAMRRILVDHARQKARIKRGGNQKRINIDDIDLASTEKDESVLLVDEALERLNQVNPQRAKVVELKFFGGMTSKETAEILGIGERSVERHWVCAKTWLLMTISARI